MMSPSFLKKNSPKWEITIREVPYLRKSIAYDRDFWYTCVETCVEWWYLQAFYHFFKILIFWVSSIVKGQKMAQSDKKLCLWHFISQQPYIIMILIYVAHV